MESSRQISGPASSHWKYFYKMSRIIHFINHLDGCSVLFYSFNVKSWNSPPSGPNNYPTLSSSAPKGELLPQQSPCTVYCLISMLFIRIHLFSILKCKLLKFDVLKHFVVASPGPLSTFLYPALGKLNSSDSYPVSLAPFASSGFGQQEAQMKGWMVGREKGLRIYSHLPYCVCTVARFSYQMPRLLSNGPSPKAIALFRADSYSLPWHLQAEKWCGFSTVFILHIALSFSGSLSLTLQLCKLSIHLNPLHGFIHSGSVSRYVCSWHCARHIPVGAESESYFTSPSFLLGL